MWLTCKKRIGNFKKIHIIVSRNEEGKDNNKESLEKTEELVVR
jgi:hypothetical protein